MMDIDFEYMEQKIRSIYAVPKELNHENLYPISPHRNSMNTYQVKAL